MNLTKRYSETNKYIVDPTKYVLVRIKDYPYIEHAQQSDVDPDDIWCTKYAGHIFVAYKEIYLGYYLKMPCKTFKYIVHGEEAEYTEPIIMIDRAKDDATLPFGEVLDKCFTNIRPTNWDDYVEESKG